MSSIYSLNKYLLTSYYEPITILDAEFIGVNSTDKNPSSAGAQLLLSCSTSESFTLMVEQLWAQGRFFQMCFRHSQNKRIIG